MSARLYDKDVVLVTTTTTGTGTLTQGAAVTGYQAPAAADDGHTFTIRIFEVDGSGVPTGLWETCESVYTHSGTTWSRGAFHDSSTGSRVSFASGTARIAVVVDANRTQRLKKYGKILAAIQGMNLS